MDMTLFEIAFHEFGGCWAWVVIVDGFMYINTDSGVRVEKHEPEPEKVYMWGFKS